MKKALFPISFNFFNRFDDADSNYGRKNFNRTEAEDEEGKGERKDINQTTK